MMNHFFLSLLLLFFSWSHSQLNLEGLPGLMRSHSTQTLGHSRLAFTLGGNAHLDEEMIQNKLLLYRESSAAAAESIFVNELQSASMNLNLALGIGESFDLAVTLPVHADVIAETRASEMTAIGLGDPYLRAKLRLPISASKIFNIGLMAALSPPLGKRSLGILPKETHHFPGDSTSPPGAQDDDSGTRFYSSGSHVQIVSTLLTFDLSRLKAKYPFKTHLNLGLLNTSSKELDNFLLLTGALEWEAMPVLTLFAEYFSQTRIKHLQEGFKIGEERSSLILGLSFRGSDGVSFSISMEQNLAPASYHSSVWTADGGPRRYDYQTASSPSVRFNTVFSFSGFMASRDRDKDGIEDESDLCPEEKEDMDGFEDNDGCPDPDNDEDSIPDVKDKCPLEPEDMDNFEDTDGCPDPDNDGDGVPDSLDKCSNDPEDMDGFEDADGCPDLDNDGDGIPDPSDKCPMEPEDKDGFQDRDGCPDPDNDGDRIPDEVDKCPLEPEIFNGFEDADGCPDLVDSPAGQPTMGQSALTKQVLGKRTVLEGVQFREGSFELLSSSLPKLESIALRLKEAPHVSVEIRVFTDNVGNEKANLALTQNRADTIRKVLIQKGVAPNRVQARGQGAKNPIATNTTARGRETNRRVEMHRIK